MEARVVGELAVQLIRKSSKNHRLPQRSSEIKSSCAAAAKRNCPSCVIKLSQFKGNFPLYATFEVGEKVFHEPSPLGLGSCNKSASIKYREHTEKELFVLAQREG